MLYDRQYMRSGDGRPEGSVLTWIIFGTIGVFLLQIVLNRWFQSNILMDLFALSPESIQSGFVWTLLTYSFLHSPNHLMHIIVNMLMAFFIGRELLPVLGNKLFSWLYFGAAVIGGTTWLLVNFIQGGPAVVGASGAVMGLLIFFACMYPNRPITLLLFFVIPITVKPKYIAYAVIAIDTVGLIFFEIAGGGTIAHSAHLGGAMVGGLFYYFIFSGQTYASTHRPQMEMPSWFKKKSKLGSTENHYQVNLSNRIHLQQEVDRILDKINSEGFGSLNEEEKEILDRAKDLLNH